MSKEIIIKDVKALKNGPIIITTSEGKCALCRCGKSSNNGFCDGSHLSVDFKSDEKVLTEMI